MAMQRKYLYRLPREANGRRSVIIVSLIFREMCLNRLPIRFERFSKATTVECEDLGMHIKYHLRKGGVSKENTRFY